MMTAWRTCQSLQRAASPGMRNCPAISMKLATMVIMNRCPGGQSSIPETQSTQAISPQQQRHPQSISRKISGRSCPTGALVKAMQNSISFASSHIQALEKPISSCLWCKHCNFHIPAASSLPDFLQSLPREAFDLTIRCLFLKGNVWSNTSQRSLVMAFQASQGHHLPFQTVCWEMEEHSSQQDSGTQLKWDATCPQLNML